MQPQDMNANQAVADPRGLWARKGGLKLQCGSNECAIVFKALPSGRFDAISWLNDGYTHDGENEMQLQWEASAKPNRIEFRHHLLSANQAR